MKFVTHESYMTLVPCDPHETCNSLEICVLNETCKRGEICETHNNLLTFFPCLLNKENWRKRKLKNAFQEVPMKYHQAAVFKCGLMILFGNILSVLLYSFDPPSNWYNGNMQTAHAWQCPVKGFLALMPPNISIGQIITFKGPGTRL